MHDKKIIEGGPSHSDRLALGNSTDSLEIGYVGTVAAAGTNQATGGALVAAFTTVTAADDTKCVVLPAGRAGKFMTVANTVADKYLPVFPPVGGKINAGADNAAWNIPNGQCATFYASSATAWHTSVAAGV
jgi:hypothetical protein